MLERAEIKRLGITRGEFISGLIAVIIAISGYWISTERRITILEAQMKDMQENKQELRSDMKELKSGLIRIELLLKDKKDK